MTSAQSYFPRQRLQDAERSWEEVAVDVGKGCNGQHCVFRQILSHSGFSVSSYTCHGEQLNKGCLMKRDVFSLKPSPRELVYHSFLARLKFVAGPTLGYDIRSGGAEGIFKYWEMQTAFNGAFEDYIQRQIGLDEVFQRVIDGKDIAEIVGMGIRNSSHYKKDPEVDRGLEPARFFG